MSPYPRLIRLLSRDLSTDFGLNRDPVVFETTYHFGSQPPVTVTTIVVEIREEVIPSSVDSGLSEPEDLSENYLKRRYTSTPLFTFCRRSIVVLDARPNISEKSSNLLSRRPLPFVSTSQTHREGFRTTSSRLSTRNEDFRARNILSFVTPTIPTTHLSVEINVSKRLLS